MTIIEIIEIGYMVITTISIMITLRLLVKIEQAKKAENQAISQPKSLLPETTVEYNEEDIIKHLDYIIDEAINTYVLFNIMPKNVYYINKNMEDEMVNNLMDSIPDRISQTLLTKLSYIYNESFVGKFLGEYIYMKITEFVIGYNTENGANK